MKEFVQKLYDTMDEYGTVMGTNDEASASSKHVIMLIANAENKSEENIRCMKFIQAMNKIIEPMTNIVFSISMAITEKEEDLPVPREKCLSDLEKFPKGLAILEKAKQICIDQIAKIEEEG